MGRISNLEKYNDRRQNIIKVKDVNDDTILFTKDDAMEALSKYISDDLKLFSKGVSKLVKDDLDNKIASRLTKFENSLVAHIDDKINKITERIIDSILEYKIEAEVNKRLDAKLEKIKKAL